jgi:hypothetical protein
MSNKITLKKVRLSFPSLFKMGSFGGESTGKYEATFVLDKKEHAEEIKKLDAEILNLMKSELKTKLSSDKICLKGGDELERPEFADKYTIKASTKKRPLVVDRDKSPLAEEDGKIYAGCYVNAIVSLWAQNNQYGKRINAQLDGVQFHSDGEPFGDAGITVDEFDAFGDGWESDEEIPF